MFPTCRSLLLLSCHFQCFHGSHENLSKHGEKRAVSPLSIFIQLSLLRGQKHNTTQHKLSLRNHNVETDDESRSQRLWKFPLQSKLSHLQRLSCFLNSCNAGDGSLHARQVLFTVTTETLLNTVREESPQKSDWHNIKHNHASIHSQHSHHNLKSTGKNSGLGHVCSERECLECIVSGSEL